MKYLQNWLDNLHPYVLSSIATVLTVLQIILAFFLSEHTSEAIQWVGWICIWSSGIFGLLPIMSFHKKGEVSQGDNYMKTTKLVDTGLYAIVRHPQGGTAWLLINLGVMLITWHWVSVVLGLASMAIVYVDTYKADQILIEKFGSAYKLYIKRVPRVNFVAGIIRLARSPRLESEE